MSRRPIHLGHDQATPLVLGDVDGAPAVQVEATGLFLALRKGDRRWVTGSQVQPGINTRSLIVLSAPAPMSSGQLAAAVQAETPEATTKPPPGEVFTESSTAATKRAPVKAPAPKKVAAKKVPAAKAAAKKTAAR